MSDQHNKVFPMVIHGTLSRKIRFASDSKATPYSIFKSLLFIVMASIVANAQSSANRICDIREYGAKADDPALATVSIQKAIDDCSSKGGGIVLVAGGTFRSGGITVKSGISLRIEKGAVLKGSDRWQDYFGSRWDDSFIRMWDVKDVGIEGEGLIDGSDCKNPAGEEGFRGPHGIYLKNVTGFQMKNFSITRTGNYNIIVRNSSQGLFDGIKVMGGHDGINAWGSKDVNIRNVDIRTGDDGIAGTNNHRFTVTDSRINSSCNAFRFACMGFTVQRTKIYGPGQYIHQISKRSNMLAAFVHFSPEARGPTAISDDWLIEDVEVDSCITLYLFDWDKGLWQQGKPVQTVRFNRVKATRIQQPVVVIGDGKTSLVFNESNITHHLIDIGGETRGTGESDGFAFALQKMGRLDLYDTDVSNFKDLTRVAVSADALKMAVVENLRVKSTSALSPFKLSGQTRFVQGPSHFWAMDGSGVDSSDQTKASALQLSGTASFVKAEGALGGSALNFGSTGAAKVTKASLKGKGDALSFLVRFRTDIVVGHQMLIEEGGSDAGAALFLTGDSLVAIVRSGNATVTAGIPGVKTGKWHMAALTFEAGRLRLILDDASKPVEVVSASVLTIPESVEGIGFGTVDGSSVAPVFGAGQAKFTGLLDDVRVLHGAAMDYLRIATLFRRGGISVGIRYENGFANPNGKSNKDLFFRNNRRGALKASFGHSYSQLERMYPRLPAMDGLGRWVP